MVGKLFCNINFLEVKLESERALHEGQVDFKVKRSCIDSALRSYNSCRVEPGDKAMSLSTLYMYCSCKGVCDLCTFITILPTYLYSVY